MEIISIARALWRKPTGALLVALQIAISLAIVINAALFVHTRIEKVQRDNGMDTKNIIIIQTQGTSKAFPSPQGIERDLNTIKQIPGVITATHSSQIPESGSGGAINIKNSAENTATKTTINYYYVGPGIIESLGLKLVEGRKFQLEDLQYDGPNSRAAFTKKVIITRNVAEKLFPGESPLGRFVYNQTNDAAEVIGVVEHMHGAWPSWKNFDHIGLFPRVSPHNNTHLIVRVEPGMRETLQTQLEDQLSQDQSQRLIKKVTAFEVIRDKTYNDDLSLAKLLLAVITLLIAVSALGVIALASFTVKQRTRQIGTRRAVGASKGQILAYFFKENTLISTFALICGSILAIVLNMLLVQHFGMPKLDARYIILGSLLLWLAGALAVYRPAKAAAEISPVVATRNV